MTRSEIVDKLLSEYRGRQRQNERDRDKAVAEIRARDPEIRRLQDENVRLFGESTRKLFAERENALAIAQALREKVMRNQGIIKQRLVAIGLPADALDLHYACPVCKDTGYDGNRFCTCFEQKLLKEMFAISGVEADASETFERFDEGIYPTAEQRLQALNAKKICYQYADSFPATDARNLLLMGTSGLGKTFLLNAIAEHVLSRGIPALRVTAFRMLEAMRACHFGQVDGRGGEFEQMISAQLLLIDDLGTEPLFNNITVEYLFLLLNERTAAARHTVIATNLTTTELQARYGERIMSRLMDRRNTTFLRLTGEDLRRTARRTQE
ncbi:MAG: ATP-binding protein [Christensenellales bacterium]